MIETINGYVAVKYVGDVNNGDLAGAALWAVVGNALDSEGKIALYEGEHIVINMLGFNTPKVEDLYAEGLDCKVKMKVKMIEMRYVLAKITGSHTTPGQYVGPREYSPIAMIIRDKQKKVDRS